MAAAMLAASLVAAAQVDNAANLQPRQDHEILSEACGMIKNAQKLAACLDALARMEDVIAQVPEKTPAEQAAARKRYLKKKYAAVTRAFEAIKSATANRVSFEKYVALIDSAANELAPARPRTAFESERQALQSFDLAIEEYRQAAKNWEAAEKFGLPASSFVVPKWRLARDAVKQAESLLFEPAPRSLP